VIAVGKAVSNQRRAAGFCACGFVRSKWMLRITLIRMSWLRPGDLRCIRRFRGIPGAAAQLRNPSRDLFGWPATPRGSLFIFCVAGDVAWCWLRRPSNRNNHNCPTTSKSPSCKSDSRRSRRPRWHAIPALLGSRRRSSGRRKERSSFVGSAVLLRFFRQTLFVHVKPKSTGVL
jgi:hypothetical protein